MRPSRSAVSKGDRLLYILPTNPAHTWLSHAERTIYLSQDTAAPTLDSATTVDRQHTGAYLQRGPGRSREPGQRRLHGEEDLAERRADDADAGQRRPSLHLGQHGNPDAGLGLAGEGSRYERAGVLHESHVGHGQQAGRQVRQRGGHLHRHGSDQHDREHRRRRRACDHRAECVPRAGGAGRRTSAASPIPKARPTSPTTPRTSGSGSMPRAAPWRPTALGRIRPTL